MQTKGQWIVVGSIVGILALAIGVGVAFSPSVRPVGPGSRARGFEAVNVRTGERASLADYEGEVILLNIWATWCLPCEQEMPSLQRLHDSLVLRGLRIVAVSIDKGDPDKVLEWVQERGLTFDVLQDRSGRIQRLYQTTGVPESFLINRDGVIIKREIGAKEWDAPAWIASIQRLLWQERGQ